MPRPYDHTFSCDRYVKPQLAFMASLPAFTGIGKRFDQIVDAQWRYEKGTPWRQLLDEMEAQRCAPSKLNDLEQRSDGSVDQFRFECGYRNDLTFPQKLLFDWFETHQEPIRDALTPAIHGLFEASRNRLSLFPYDHGLNFPDDATDREKLDRFQISHFTLDPAGRDLIIELESLDPWFSEHGCCVVVRDGQVASWGSWDEVQDADNGESWNFEPIMVMSDESAEQVPDTEPPSGSN